MKRWQRMRSLVTMVRDHRFVGPVARFPFEQLQALGVPIPKGLYQHLPYRGDFEVECPGGRKFRMRAYGEVVENSVYWEGIFGHESECIAPWMEYSRRAHIILDIGANTGLYSLIAYCVAPDAIVHAFEPVQRIADRLQENVALNPGARINVHRVAVGSRDGEVTIYDPGGANVYSASLRADFIAGDKASYSVPVVSIDALVANGRINGSIDLMKIDVEGSESDVLSGAKQTIDRDRPTILLELLPSTISELTKSIEALLSADYQMLHLTRKGSIKADRVSLSPDSQNVLLVHGSKLGPAQ